MSPGLSFRPLAAAALALLAGLSLSAHAQVHKCTQADGSVVFQAGPCIAEEPRTERVSAAQLNAAQRAREARARAKAAAASGAGSASAHGRATSASRPRPGK